MANKVTITSTDNKITVTPQNTNTSISTTTNSVIVNQGSTRVVQVNTPGPKGLDGIIIEGGDKVFGNITASNVSGSATASFGLYLGDGSQLTGIQTLIDSSSFAITGSDVTFSNITSSGGIIANKFFGDGSELTGITSPLTDTGSFAITGSNVTFGNITASNVSGSATASFGLYLGDGSQLTGIQTSIDSSSFAITGSDVTFRTITASGTFKGNGLIIDGPSNSHVEVGEYPVGYDFAPSNTLFITGSGLIISGAMADANHHNMLKIGNVELIDLNTSTSPNEFLIHNVNSFKITSGSDGGDIANASGRLFEHNGNSFTLFRNNSSTMTVNANNGVTFNGETISFVAGAGGTSMKATNTTSTSTYILTATGNPTSTPQVLNSINAQDFFRTVGGAITASAISASGNIIATDITASGNVKIDNNLSLGGSIFTFEGFNFIEGNITSLTGSNIFGSGSEPSLNDAAGGGIAHQFTGSVSITGSNLNVIGGDISASGVINADYFNAGNLDAYYIQSAKVLFAEDGDFKFGNTFGPGTVVEGSSITLNSNVTASGNISASGDMHYFGGRINTPRLDHIDPSSQIFFGNGINVNGKVVADDFQILGTSATITVISSSVNTIHLGNTRISGDLSITSSNFVVSSSSTNFFSHITASGNVSSSATASFGLYLGDGSQLTGIQTSIDSSSFAITGSDVTFSNITASGNISASGTITANKFFGDGSELTGITSTPLGSDNFAITGDDVDFKSITASGANIENIITSNGTTTKFVFLPRGSEGQGEVEDGAIVFGGTDGDNFGNGGFIYDDGDRLNIGYNNDNIFTVNDTSVKFNKAIIFSSTVLLTTASFALTSSHIEADTITTNNIVLNNSLTTPELNITGTGVPTIISATNIILNAANAVVISNSPLRLKSYTNAQTASAVTSEGDTYFNSDTKNFMGFNGTNHVILG